MFVSGVLIFALAVTIATAENESEYDGCAKRLHVLEKALFDTGSNRFELNTVFFPPSQRPTRFIRVEYSFGADSDCNVTYIWAIGAFLFFQPPSVFKFTSLYFNYPNNDLTLLHLDLPSECKGLIQSQDNASCSCSHGTPLLDVLTQQLDVYAAYIEVSNVQRQNSFARAVCAENIHEMYYDADRTEFMFVIICIAILLPFSFILIIFILLRNAKDGSSKSSNFNLCHSKLVALVLVGIVFSACILTCNILACQTALSSNHEYSEYVSSSALNLRITIATLFLDCIFVLPQVLSLFYIFYHNVKLFFGIKQHLTPWYSFLRKFIGYFHKTRKTISDDDDIIDFILPLMLLPPFLCFSTHLGYIIFSWLTEPPKCTTQVLLLYLTLGFLFVMLKKCYTLHSTFEITLRCDRTAKRDGGGVELQTRQPASKPKPSVLENKETAVEAVQGKTVASINIDTGFPPKRKNYINTQAFCLIFMYGIVIIGICIMIILMFLLLPLESEEIVVYLFNAFQLIILIISTQFTYKVLFSSDDFNIDKFWKNFRNYFSNKNETEFHNEEILSAVKDDEATNSETAGVVAAEITKVIMKKLN